MTSRDDRPLRDDVIDLTSPAGRDRLRQPVARPRRGGRGARSRRSSPGGRATRASRPSVLEATPGRPSVLVRAPRAPAAGARCCCAGTSTPSSVEGMADPHAPRVDGDRLLRPRRLRHEGRRRRGAGRLPRGWPRSGWPATSSSPRSPTRSTRASASRRCCAPCSADAAIVTEPTELERRVAHKGFVWVEVEVTGRAAHGSRPHLGVDAIVKAGPILTALGALDAALGARDAPAARPRLGARVADRGRRASCRATRRAARSASSAARCPARPRRRRGRARRAARPLPRRGPRARAAQRTLLVREPFEVAQDARDRRGGAGARPPTRSARPGDRRRELLGRRGVHRRGRHPDRDVRARRRGRPRRRGVGQHRRHRGGRPHAGRRGARLCAMRALVNAARRPGARSRRRATDARAFHARAARLRADAAARAAATGRELGLGAVGGQGRVRPARAAGVQGARRVVGGGAGAARAARTSRTLVAASAGNHGRAVAHVAARRGLALPDLPARPLGARPARGDRRRGRRGRRRRRELRGRGRARRARAARRARRARDRRRRRRPARRAGSSTATRRCSPRSATQAAVDVLLVPGRRRLARRPRPRASARRDGRARSSAVEPVDRRLPDRLAGRRRARPRSPTPGHDDGRAWTAPRSRAAAWPSLRDGIAGTVTVSDAEAHAAMRELAAAGLRDRRLRRRAAGRAARAGRRTPACAAAARGRRPAARARGCVLIATEGPTDPPDYARVVGAGSPAG